MDAGGISDEQLREELLTYGVNAGPITPTTKNVYVKKLLKLRNDFSNHETVGNDNSVPAPTAAEVETPVTRRSLYPDLAEPVSTGPRQRKTKSPVKAASAELDNGEVSSGDEAEESVRYLSPEEIEFERSRHSFIQPKASGSPLKRIVYFFAVAAIALFLFFLLNRAVEEQESV